MANVLNRTTKQYLVSVNTSDYPVGGWIISPDTAAVDGFATKYWVIVGDVVSLMDSAARDAVDAAEKEASRDDAMAEIDDNEAMLRAFAGAVLDELNFLRSHHALAPRTLLQLRTAMRNKLGS